jgi:hypothetical protein
MTVKKLKNAAMSIRQKLLNKANAENRTFNEILLHGTLPVPVERFFPC